MTGREDRQEGRPDTQQVVAGTDPVWGTYVNVLKALVGRGSQRNSWNPDLVVTRLLFWGRIWVTVLTRWWTVPLGLPVGVEVF